MKTLRLAAIFLAALIIMMPVTLAQELSVTVTGNDKAKNYLKPEDTLFITAQASIPGEQIISNDQLRIYVDQSFAFFDNCTRLANSTTFNCIFSDDSFVGYQPVTFDIELRNDDDKVLLRNRQIAKVDSISPTIPEFNITPLLSTGQVTLKYNALDYGVDPTKLQNCSGIKEVSLRLNNNILFTEPGQLGTCTKEKSSSILLNESGRVCISASDFVGHRTTRPCITVQVDKTPPIISAPRITSTDGTVISHVRKGETTLATVSISITDDTQVDAKSVSANLASISPAYKDYTAPDLFTSGIAVWRNVPLTESPSCSIGVRAKDKLGSQSDQQFACSIKSDNIPPTFAGVFSERQRDNLPLLGKDSVISLDFVDKDSTGGTGAGMGRRLAYLDLSSLSLGTFVQADTCLLQNDRWRCAWNLQGITKPEGTYEIRIAQGTADDLGNVLENTTAFNVVYDNTAPAQPIIRGMRVIKGEETSNITVPVAGNYVEYTVVSANFTDAFANFGQIGSGERTVGTCNTDENGPTCTFEGKILLDGPYTAGITFGFSDDAGNTVGTNTTLNVVGVDNATTARYWQATTSCSPRLIDRSTASVFAPYVTCRLNLSTPRRDITTLSITGADPTQCGALNQTLVLNDAYLTNNYEGSTNPFLNLKLEAKDYYVDSLNITCPITIFSQRNTSTGFFVSPNPQVIPVKVNLGLYNNPKQDMYNEIDRQIEDAMEDSFASMEWLGIANKIVHYANIICQVKDIITSVLQLVDVLSIIISGVADGAKTGPQAVAYPTLEGIKQTLCGTGDGIAKSYQTSIVALIDPICSIINCNMGDKKDWGVPGVGTGGGAPYCKNIQDFFNTIGGQGSASSLDALSGKLSADEVTENKNFLARASGGNAFNIKDSLIWSAVCVCIPGVIYNVEKLRQIQCYKAVCLNDKVKGEGYPVSTCNEMYHYLLCQYVVGQIFAAIPFANFFNKIVDLVVSVITDPMAAFTFVVGALCLPFCNVPATPPLALCAIPRSLSLLGEAIAAVYQMAVAKTYFSPPPGSEYCKRMEKIKDELGEKDEPK